MKKIKLACLFIIFLWAGMTNASVEESDSKIGGFSLSPFLKEITIQADEKEKVFSLKIKNNSNKVARVSFVTNDFSFLNDKIVILDGNNKNDYSLTQWLEMEEEECLLQSNEERNVKIKIVNDDKLAPGGHYGAITAKFRENSEEEKTNMKLDSTMTALVFLRKLGGERYGMELEKQEFFPRIFKLENKIKIFFKNTGNVHIVPRGLVTLMDPWGREVARGIINNESGIILPEKSKGLTIDFFRSKVVFMPGKYKLVTQYRHDSNSGFELKEESFIHIPLVFIGAVGLSIFFLGGIVLRRQLKMRNNGNDNPDIKKQSLSSGVKKKIAHKIKWVVLAIVLSMLGWYGYDNFFQKPISGKIVQEMKKERNAKNIPLERFEAKYLSFRHSPMYRVNFHEKEIIENKNILERALLSQVGSEGKKIALTVEDMNHRNLTDVASYNLRKKMTDRYVESKFNSSDWTGNVFVSRENDIFEKTVFIYKENKLIEISFSSVLNSESETEKESEDVIASIQWKKM